MQNGKQMILAVNTAARIGWVVHEDSAGTAEDQSLLCNAVAKTIQVDGNPPFVNLSLQII
jgi:hypothetical protein